MKHPLAMPKAGLTNTEGTVASWAVETGTKVSKKEVVGEIENEKSTIELLAPEEGYLVIVGQVGEEYKVGEPIAYIVDSEDEIDGAEEENAPAEEKEEAAPAQVEKSQAQAQPKQEGERVKISPYAKKLAEEVGFDYSSLEGTGPAQSIVSRDILEALEGQEEAPEVASQTEEDEKAEEAPAYVASTTSDADYEEVAASTMRKAIAKNMKASLNTNAPAYLSTEFDVTKLFKLKDKLKEKEEILGNKISINNLLSYLIVKLAVKHPELNSQYTDDNKIRQHKHVNFSFAVENEKGLVTPVVPKADTLSLNAFSKAMKEAIDRARENKLDMEELQGGTVTLSNLGMYPVDSMMPIINHPQTSIFGVGRAVEKPVYVDGEVKPRMMMWISITFDHRNLDGAQVGRIFQSLEQFLADPKLMLMI